MTSKICSVTISVAAVNDPPEANGVGYFVTPGNSSDVDLTVHDYDVDGDDLTVISVTQPEYATVTLNVDGTVNLDIDPDSPSAYTTTSATRSATVTGARDGTSAGFGPRSPRIDG